MDRGREGRTEISRWVRAITTVAGITFLGFGLWALLSPRGFYNSIALWPPFNEHFLHDIGAFQIGIGGTLLVALVWVDSLLVALFGASVGAVSHEIAHIIDRDHGGKDSDPIVLGVLAVVLMVATAARRRDVAKRCRHTKGSGLLGTHHLGGVDNVSTTQVTLNSPPS